MDFFTCFTREKTPQNNFSSQNFSVENNYCLYFQARIVDTPCNEMHTDAFIAEVRQIGSELGINPLVIQGEELNEKGFGGT